MMPLTRRAFLGTAAQALAASRLAHHSQPFAPALTAEPAVSSQAPVFRTQNTLWQTTYDAALHVLAGNVRQLPRYPFPVLIEGAEYPGIWQECGPHEALVYRRFRPDVARHSHLTFFALQRPDGQLPANNKLSETGFGQIQMVVPIAATAWELAESTGDSELLEKAYVACSAWDGWLLRYRNTRGTGLVEGFCTYDTGQDNSPRWAGIPSQCPGKDARRLPPLPTLPRLCPDLSATVYGARRALAAMARALGKAAEEEQWASSAESLRRLILARLYVEQDAAFFDLDAENHFVRIRCDILSRVCGEHVPDQHLFDQLWSRQLHNPRAFWASYPLPSVALDDPLFVRPIPRNNWGGASQALTALRAGRWFDHYGRSAEFSQMMQRWCEAIQRDGTFRQQVDPLTGEFTHADAPGYSPAALVFYDYTWRLGGIGEERDSLHWNVRPGHPATQGAQFAMVTDGGLEARLTYAGDGAVVSIEGRRVAHGVTGVIRLLTDKRGTVEGIVGIADTTQHVTLERPGHARAHLTVEPNQRWQVSACGAFTAASSR